LFGTTGGMKDVLFVPFELFLAALILMSKDLTMDVGIGHNNESYVS
jgi:hypothetical protein